MQRLIATKSMRYATRRLQAGDVFEAKPRDARLLIAIKKARAEREPGKVAPPSPAIIQKAQQAQRTPPSADGKETLNKLRADYAEVIGKRPFNGWGAAELQRRIDEALAS